MNTHCVNYLFNRTEQNGTFLAVVFTRRTNNSYIKGGPLRDLAKVGRGMMKCFVCYIKSCKQVRLDSLGNSKTVATKVQYKIMKGCSYLKRELRDNQKGVIMFT